MRKKAILYVRVSTDEQADRGYSLRYQEERLQKYCDLHNIEIAAKFIEDHSAKTFERPEFKKLFKYAKASRGKIHYMLCIKWDRFSRNTRDSYQMINEFDKIGIEVQAIEQPLDLNVPENKLMLAFYLAAPEVENDRRSLNTISGLRRAKREGRVTGKAPKGYKNSRDENNRPIMVPNEDAQLIQEAFHDLATGVYTQEEIRKRLNKKGLVCSKTNFSWLLRNHLYIGKLKSLHIKMKKNH